MTEERQANDDRWLSLEDVSDYLGVTPDTLYRWIDERGMPAYRLGRLWKFKKGEVDDWVRDGGRGDPAQTPTPDEHERGDGDGDQEEDP